MALRWCRAAAIVLLLSACRSGELVPSAGSANQVSNTNDLPPPLTDSAFSVRAVCVAAVPFRPVFAADSGRGRSATSAVVGDAGS